MSEEEVQKEIKTPAVLEAFERAKLVSLPKDVRESYRVEEIMFENISGHIEDERKKGILEGEAKGRQEGRLEGRQEGRLEGIQEGKLETAKALIKQGISISIIKTATGLSEEEINCLE